MSGLTKSINESLEAFRLRSKVSKRRSKTASLFRQACATHGSRRARRSFTRAFLRAAITRFVCGQRAEGRRFYNAAFLFADREVVTRQLLRLALKRARLSHLSGNHSGVWYLFQALVLYLPEQELQQLRATFAKNGIILEDLGKPPHSVPSWVLAAA